MSTTVAVTADQLLQPPYQGRRCELVEGEVRMMSPAGWKHGEVVSTIHCRLAPHIEKHKLGKSFGAETGFLIARDPDTVRAPDFAFISNASLPTSDPEEAFWPGAPDLAVEVLSPDDRTGEVSEKIRAWLTAGAKEVWIVNSQLQSVTIHRSATDISVYAVGDNLVGDDQLLPGFSCTVAELFGSFVS
ncbi:MAG: Uma2 family endonuclease [Planctomycetes bacterium]|nr:Uma2 family endonuclease [Planctomycetota bacterium]